MQQNQTPQRRNRKKEAARRAKLKHQRIVRITYAATCVLLAAAILFVVIPLFQTSPSAKPVSDDVISPAVSDPQQTPRPTPTPTPEPEVTPVPTPSPTPYAYQTAGRKIDPKKKMIALTFDDGPSPTVTDDVLTALKKNKAKATFFMLGSNALNNPKVVQRVAAAGHQIGTHTHDHKSLIRLTPDEMLHEIAKSIWAIDDAGGGTATILRPPYGNTNDSVCETVVMPLINWSVDTLDWESRSAKKVYKHLIESVKDGDIVLMHDIYSTTAQAVKKALPELKKRGFQFVTIDELFEARGVPLEFGRVYRSCPK